MSVILAIDAAWTEHEPSGVAVLASSGKCWQCAATAPSYQTFLALSYGAHVDWTVSRLEGSVPNASLLLDAASRLGGASVDIITIDMPIATIVINDRRKADDAISREYGSRGCSAHTPSPSRPGPLGATFSKQFNAAGYSIATTRDRVGSVAHLIEVYPHPALLTLLLCKYRVPYKVAKTGRYWPNTTVTYRISTLLDQYRSIIEVITRKVGPVALPIPQANEVSSLAALKRYEDAIDELVCAWVGVKYLEGNAKPLGDETAAIWCPSPLSAASRKRFSVRK